MNQLLKTFEKNQISFSLFVFLLPADIPPHTVRSLNS